MTKTPSHSRPVEWMANWTRSRFGLRFLFIFLPVALLVCIVNYFYYQQELEHIQEEHAKTESALVTAGIISLDRSFQFATRDLKDLYGRISFRKMLDEPDRRNKSDVAADWLNFSASKEVYQKIRWIDETGKERVRVNYTSGTPGIVPEEKLQDRERRYYFSDTNNLEKGEIYVSPLDLSVEHGEIEVPHVATIRFGMPVFNSRGEKRGILILSLYAQDMLDRFEEATGYSSHAVWLLNPEGYWLQGGNEEDEFAFMFGKTEQGISKRHPDAWQSIHTRDTGQFLGNDGLWTFQTLHPFDKNVKSSAGSSSVFSPGTPQVDMENYEWKIVSFLPLSTYNSGMPFLQEKSIAITLFFVLICLVLTWFLLRVQDTRNHLLDHLEEMVAIRTENLSQSETRLRRLIETIPDLIWLKDTEGAYLECNVAIEKYMGLKEGSIKGKTDYELMPKEMAENYRKLDVEALNADKPQILEQWFTDPETGKEYCFEIIRAPVKTVDGRLFGILGIARNITERKESEVRLQLAGLLYKNTRDAVLITNANNEILGVNPAYEEINGYTETEVLGKNPNIISSGRQGKAFYEEMWSALKNNGFWQGELWNRRKNGEVYAAWLSIRAYHGEDGSVLGYIKIGSDFTKEKETQDIIWRQANFDFLTELPNRRMLVSRLEQEINKSSRSGGKLAILFLSIQNFKAVNEAYGHDAGDALLIQAARRLQKLVRDIDIVARYGDNEYAVVITEFTDFNSIEALAHQMMQEISEPFVLDDKIALVSANIGITIYPDDGTDKDILLQNADQATSFAKRKARTHISYFRQSMQDAAQQRMLLVQDLRSALENRQFEIAYQPIVDLSSGEILKAESLLRWNHAERGAVSPMDFIPVAEETGLIFE
ncbi:diguanylate cyclase, partial [Oxalobacter sp. OttesenSCG-928-P03]|nr:diguanylate cyclase [Oxalobacter sp. OttesenSCG-928-P03]